MTMTLRTYYRTYCIMPSICIVDIAIGFQLSLVEGVHYVLHAAQDGAYGGGR